MKLLNNSETQHNKLAQYFGNYVTLISHFNDINFRLRIDLRSLDFELTTNEL
ncbi:MAG: hypothetical protein KDH96_10720 [Candidatus Riesia sp.]|nr:hypothetical protein [Candidatus Riesia sp.]